MANNTFEAAYMKLKNGMTLFFQDSGARDLIKKLQTAVSLIHEIPAGGTTDQVLKKASNADFDVEWGAGGGGGGPTNTWYATCGTASGTGAKTATSATGDFVLATGAMVRVLFSSSNTAANPTISIDGSTAKNIRPVSGASGMDYMWKAGEVIDIVYDGSNFVMTKGGKADTSFYGITKLDSSTNSTATNVAATPKAVKDVKDMIPAASSATPQDLGTAAAGSSADYSRADHVHNKPTYTKGDVGLGNVDNVQQYSASNPPPYPVTSVNGQTGAVAIDKSSVGLGNVDNVQQYSASNPPPYPVTSVNGQTGAVNVSTIAVQDSAPVGDELVWIDTDEPGDNVTIPQIDDDNVSEDDTWSSQKISDEISSADAFHVGDSFNFGVGTVFNGYLANNNNGTMYCVLPKKIGSDITGANISWTACNWIMRPSQALSQNFGVSSLTPISGGNQVIVNFTTNISSPQYFIPILLNISNLTFTFN